MCNFSKYSRGALLLLTVAVFFVGCPQEPNINDSGDGDDNSGPSAPAFPGNLNVELSMTRDGLVVDLTWNSVVGAANYNIYRANMADALGDNPHEVISAPNGSDVVSYTDRMIEIGTTYYYAVSAVNSAGSSPRTAPVPITPRFPDISIFADSDDTTEGNQPPAAIDERSGGEEIAVVEFAAALLGSPAPEDVAYSIDSAIPVNHPFIISENQLILPAGASLDYETVAKYTIIVLATTGQPPNQSAGSIELAVPVANLDDEAPVFDNIPQSVTVATKSRVFSVGALILSATDSADGDAGVDTEISYAFIDNSGAVAPLFGDFAINAQTGEITIVTAPVYSADPAMNSRSLTIRATDTSDGATGETMAEETMVITITPSNTIALQSNSGSAIRVAESEGAPVTITTISITTAGVSLAPVDPYAIAGDPAGFAITDEGKITAQLDYEMLSSEERTAGITITALATGSQQGQAGSIVLTILVDNIDDEAPVFDPDTIPAAATIAAETRTISEPIRIVATDSADGDAGNNAEISYALVDNLGNAAPPNGSGLSIFDGFAINVQTGEITADDAPEFSASPHNNRRVLTIRATDTSNGATGEIADETEVIITVTPPDTIALDSSNGDEITIAESDGSFISVTDIGILTSGITLSAANPYAIAGEPAGFAIDGAGKLTARLDYEALTDTQKNDGIAITIQATGDVEGQTGSIDLTIRVNNLDDEAPELEDPPVGVTVEAGSTTLSVGTLAITATDSADGDEGNDTEIFYAFVNKSNNPVQILDDFAIDAVTGTITVATAPVFSNAPAGNKRTLTIRATDNSPDAKGKKTSEKDITITVTPPGTIDIESTAGAEISIDESDRTFVPVTTINIITPGVTPAARNPYTITGSPAGFSITDQGQLTARLDYERLSDDQKENGVTITVQVTGSGADQNATIVLTIMVANIDDEVPIFGDIPEGVTIEAGTTTLSVDPLVITATDDFTTAANNDNPNAEISYEFVGNVDNFVIDANTGVITVVAAPQFLGNAHK